MIRKNIVFAVENNEMIHNCDYYVSFLYNIVEWIKNSDECNLTIVFDNVIFELLDIEDNVIKKKLNKIFCLDLSITIINHEELHIELFDVFIVDWYYYNLIKYNNPTFIYIMDGENSSLVNNIKYPCIKSSVLYDDKIWFSNDKNNGLWNYSITNKSFEFIGHFVNEKNISELHQKVIQINNKIFFIPNRGMGITIYDTITNKQDYVIIERFNGNDFVMDAVVINNKIYILYNNINIGMLAFDTDTYELSYETWHIDSIKNKVKCSNIVTWFYYLKVYNGVIWTVISGTPYIVSLDVINMRVSTYNVGSDIQLVDIVYDNDYFWLITNNSMNVYKWSLNTKKLTCIKYIQNNEVYQPYGRIDVFNNEIVITPWNIDSIVTLNRTSEEFNLHKLDIDKVDDFRKNKCMFWSTLYLNNNLFCWLPYGIDKCITLNDGIITANIFELCEINYKCFYQYFFNDEEIYISNVIDVNTFLNWYNNSILKKRATHKMVNNIIYEKNYGLKIWETLKKKNRL